MIRTTTFRAFLAGGAGLALGAMPAAVTPALAQQQRPPAEITIINARQVPLTMLEIATTGEQPRLVGKLERELAPGQQVRLRLTRPAGCSYFVLARFSDESESESDGLNLCGERQLRLTD
jgi:hypothetical protein